MPDGRLACKRLVGPWLLDRERVHDDSFGHESCFDRAASNVMPSGTVIAHAEQMPANNSGPLGGVQLWVACWIATVTCPRAFGASGASASTRNAAGAEDVATAAK
jgi:hypothetical protein